LSHAYTSLTSENSFIALLFIKTQTQKKEIGKGEGYKAKNQRWVWNIDILSHGNSV